MVNGLTGRGSPHAVQRKALEKLANEGIADRMYGSGRS
jgi:hypothetical protein